MELEDEIEDLVERDLQSVVSGPCQETLFENGVQVRIVQANQLLEVVDLCQLLLEKGPLALDHGNHDILVNRSQKVLHLLPQELQFAQLFEITWWDSLNIWKIVRSDITIR